MTFGFQPLIFQGVYIDTTTRGPELQLPEIDEVPNQNEMVTFRGTITGPKTSKKIEDLRGRAKNTFTKYWSCKST